MNVNRKRQSNGKQSLRPRHLQVAYEAVPNGHDRKPVRILTIPTANVEPAPAEGWGAICPGEH